MNGDTPANSPLLTYYDLDHPWPEDAGYAAAMADPIVSHEIGGDIAFMCEFARAAEGPVLDLCCGTGRLSLPIARLGRPVVGLDLSPVLLARFAERLAAEPSDVRERCRPVEGDACDFSLDGSFALAVVGFNSLCMLPDQQAQRRALARVNRHLDLGARLIVDITNPLMTQLSGTNTPQVILSRAVPERGLSYTRWMVRRTMDASQRQVLEGWYDIVDATGALRREHYSKTFRYIYKDEGVLMLEGAGFEIESVFGNHAGAPWSPFAQKITFVARKIRDAA
jgi:SAM-dependent methyltransferase